MQRQAPLLQRLSFLTQPLPQTPTPQPRPPPQPLRQPFLWLLLLPLPVLPPAQQISSEVSSEVYSLRRVFWGKRLCHILKQRKKIKDQIEITVCASFVKSLVTIAPPFVSVVEIQSFSFPFLLYIFHATLLQFAYDIHLPSFAY